MEDKFKQERQRERDIQQEVLSKNIELTGMQFEYLKQAIGYTSPMCVEERSAKFIAKKDNVKPYKYKYEQYDITLIEDLVNKNYMIRRAEYDTPDSYVITQKGLVLIEMLTGIKIFFADKKEEN